jgi:hypothetical protein
MTLDSFLEQRTWIPKTAIAGLTIWMLAGAGIKPGEPLDLPEPIPIEQLSPLPTPKPMEEWNPRELVEEDKLPQKVEDKVQELFQKYSEEPRFQRDFNTRLKRLEPYLHLFAEASGKYGVETNYMVAKAMVESAGVVRARSNKGARGLMQIMPRTAKWNKCSDYTSAKGSINCAAKILGKIMDRYSNKTGNVAGSRLNLYHVSGGYLGGFTLVSSLIGKDSNHVFSDEVTNYGAKILAFKKMLDKKDF